MKAHTAPPLPPHKPPTPPPSTHPADVAVCVQLLECGDAVTLGRAHAPRVLGGEGAAQGGEQHPQVTEDDQRPG